MSEARPSLFAALPQTLMGKRITAVSVVSDDHGVTAIHLLGDDGKALKVQPGDPGYLDVNQYQGWRLRG